MTEAQPTFGSRLASEAEVLLAQQDARAGLDDASFLRRLVDVDAHLLYATILNTILEQYRSSLKLKESNLSFYQDLQREKKWLQSTQQWPASLIPLAELFVQND